MFHAPFACDGACGSDSALTVTMTQPATDSTPSFGQWVKQSRKRLEWTQLQLADRVGCAVITLQKIEANALRPSSQIARLLATALRIPADEQAAFLEAARAVTPGNGKSRPSSALASAPAAAPAKLLLGRERVLDGIFAQLARSEVRLLTLFGPPGVGKTRLALAVVEQANRRLPRAFPDGVVFVSLAEVQAPDLVLPTLARQLGLKDAAAQTPLVQLGQHLQSKHVLLVLDNFEHVLSAAGAIESLLAAAPEITCVVTSRMLLKLENEHAFAVAPLDLPDATRLPSLARLTQHAAVALFVERARQANPAFVLNAANASTIAQICIQLDGLPLAIELAAAYSRFLNPAALLQRLERRLPMLRQRAPESAQAGGANDAAQIPARQRRLREAIAWSYEQLESEEQQLFNQLGVFVGGWTTEAAEAVSISAGASTAHETVMLDVFSGLETLLDNSLIVRRAEAQADTPHFSMLETLREFALEQLARNGQLDEVSHRHAAYFLNRVRGWEPEINSPRQIEVADELEDVHDNIRAALRWTLIHEPTMALELAGRLGSFWQLRSYFSEGRRWLEQALALTEAVSLQSPNVQSLRARALNSAGILAYRQSDYEHATTLLQSSIALSEHLEDEALLASALNQLGNVKWDQSDLQGAWETYRRALVLARELNDSHRLAAVLSNMGSLAWYRRDLDTAQAMLKESLALRRKGGERDGIATALTNLGGLMLTMGDIQQALLYQRESLAIFRQLNGRQGMAMVMGNLANTLQEAGESAEARQLYEESLAIRREIGDRWGAATALAHLGRLARHLGDFGEAVAALQDSLSIMRQLNDRWYISHDLNDLGDVALAMGNIEQARSWHAEALQLQRELADVSGQLNSLAGFADIAAATGDVARAALGWGAVESAREQLGEKLSPREEREWQAQLAKARQHQPEAFDKAREAGRVLSLDEALLHVGRAVTFS